MAKDPDRTIDGTDKTRESSAEPRPTPVKTDYSELLAVDRAHYNVTGVLATGGMGRVLEARDLRLGRDVAIKELLPQRRDLARRFEREARITARLQHPAIIHVYEAGVWPGGEPFYAMPRVAGQSLDKVVARYTTLNGRLGLLPNVIAVADALAYAHSQRVIHRDLKPSNVLVGEFGQTVVIDWGLAKDLTAPADPKESLQFRVSAVDQDTAVGSVVGTPAYMAPEQANAEPLDQRADVYALGALLYKVLSGVAPYTGESSKEVLELVKAGPPRMLVEREPGVPPPLLAIVDKAMARDPGKRYATAAELAQDLKRFETGQLVAAHRYTRAELTWRFLRRYRVVVAAALVLVVVAGVSVVRILVERNRAEESAGTAKRRRVELLVERARTELLAGHGGAALAYLVVAAQADLPDGPESFMLAEAMRPFKAQIGELDGTGPLVAVVGDGKIATAGVGAVELWDGAKAQILLARPARIHALVADTKNKHVAAGGDDRIVWVWDLDGRLVATLPVQHTILDLALSPDGDRVAIAGYDGLAAVWDIHTGKPVATSSLHGNQVNSVRFSADGRYVLTASDDESAAVWRATTGKIDEDSAHLHGHTKRVNVARWLPDGKRVVTAGSDGTARVFSAKTGKLVVALLQHEPGSEVITVAVSSDGRYVVTAGTDEVAKVWKLPTMPEEGATPPAAHQVLTLAHGNTIVDVAFSPDDSLIATAGLDRTAKVWDARTGHVRATFEHDDKVTSLAFAAGGAQLVTGTANGKVRIWNTQVNKFPKLDLESEVHAIAVAPDGTLAAATEETTTVTLARRTGTPTALPGHVGRVFAVAFDPAGTKLVTGGEDEKLLVWDVATGLNTGELGSIPAGTTALRFSPDGNQIAAGTKGGIRLWSLKQPDVSITLSDAAAVVNAVEFDHDSRVIGGADDGVVIVWDLVRHTSQSTKVLDRPITALALSPDGKTLAIGAQATVLLYDLTDGTLAGTSSMRLDDATGGIVHALAWTHHGTLISGAETGAKIWDPRAGRLLGKRDASGLTSIALDGDTLWTAGLDHMVQAWDVGMESRPVLLLQAFANLRDPCKLDAHDILSCN